LEEVLEDGSSSRCEKHTAMLDLTQQLGSPPLSSHSEVLYCEQVQSILKLLLQLFDLRATNLELKA
jgi:hypothetical protein